jgi:hypothetical protein
VVAALAIPSSPATAPTSGKPGFAYQSEDLSVWFHGKKGFVKVFRGNQSDPDNSSVYSYHTGAIVERDAANRTLAIMNLERAYPQSSNCTITDDGEFVNMTITITDDVKAVGRGNSLATHGHASHPARGGTGTPSSLGQATVSFVYHFNKTSNEAKFDVDLAGWPWLGGVGLAYQFSVDAEGATVQTADNGVGIVNATGAQVGFIEWADHATVTYADDHEEEAGVESNATSDGGHAAVTLAFTDVDPGYVSLAYDPTLGVGLWLIVGGHLVAAPVPSVGTLRYLLRA